MFVLILLAALVHSQVAALPYPANQKSQHKAHISGMITPLGTVVQCLPCFNRRSSQNAQVQPSRRIAFTPWGTRLEQPDMHVKCPIYEFFPIGNNDIVVQHSQYQPGYGIPHYRDFNPVNKPRYLSTFPSKLRFGYMSDDCPNCHYSHDNPHKSEFRYPLMYDPEPVLYPDP